MKVLIVEDELQAAQHIERLVREIVPGVTILARLDSVKKAIQWFREHEPPDVVLMDIQLADGVSFGIFSEVEVKSPVIFTTAYDEYALRAFKVNSIDYILKPVDRDELAAAVKKLQSFTGAATPTNQMLDNLASAVEMLTKKYKTRFVIKVGEHLKTIEVKNIQFFFSQDKATFCVTAEGRSFVLDFTLEQLEEMTDPAEFFRINRKYLVRSDAIQDIIQYSNSRLRLVLRGSQDKEIIVARERVQEFRDWLDR